MSSAPVLDHRSGPDTWDPRSVEKFPIRRLTAEVPVDASRSYWWSPGMAKLDQSAATSRMPAGPWGHCGGFGAANEAQASPIRVKGIDNDWGHDFYYEIKDRRLDPWGREDGTSSLAVAKLGVIRNLWDSYWWVDEPEDIVRGLSVGPMTFGVVWREGQFTPDRYGFIEPTGAENGGHFVCANGYSPNYRGRGPTVRITQSWGRDHGVNGNVYLRLPHLVDLVFEQQGEGFVPVGRDFPVPTAAV
jgi:hypothetical protein